MNISIEAMAAGSFAPMLNSLSEWLDKGFGEKGREVELVNARLAPDMYALAQQVQQACHYAKDGVARLAGRPAEAMEEAETTLAGLKAQIVRTLGFVGSVPAAAF